MKFSEIIGQESVKQRLFDMVDQGKVPHAFMFTGNEGCGAMPLAIAFAQYLLCQGSKEPEQPASMGLFGFDEPAAPVTLSHESCGKCKSCLMASHLQHPDLHFMFPIFKLKGRSADHPTYCDDYITEWRDLLLSNPYFSYSDWMEAIEAENQQLTIYEAESDAIFRKLSLASSQGGNKVCLIWLPEKMNSICANKMLKLLEEPPERTFFIMVSEHPELLLQTIRSRVQSILVPSIPDNDMAKALIERHKILPASAQEIARTAHGNMAFAIHTINNSNDNAEYFELFVRLMRLSYMRKVKEMRMWSEEVAKLGRERQKRFLAYCQKMIRENFMYNFHKPELNYMSGEEADFAVKFAPFINENNVIGIMNELALCDRDITQNANPKIVFFDFSLKMIVLIKNR